jgi:hypothetical protein
VHDDKNASQTAPLKFLVFHVAKKGDPLAFRCSERTRGENESRANSADFMGRRRRRAEGGGASKFLDQAPRSFAFQKGPPGWTRKTWHTESDRLLSDDLK